MTIQISEKEPANLSGSIETQGKQVNRSTLWVIIIWAVLIVKSILISESLIHYKAGIHPLWIWIPSLIAGTLLSIYILRDEE